MALSDSPGAAKHNRRGQSNARLIWSKAEARQMPPLSPWSPKSDRGYACNLRHRASPPGRRARARRLVAFCRFVEHLNRLVEVPWDILVFQQVPPRDIVLQGRSARGDIDHLMRNRQSARLPAQSANGLSRRAPDYLATIPWALASNTAACRSSSAIATVEDAECDASSVARRLEPTADHKRGAQVVRHPLRLGAIATRGPNSRGRHGHHPGGRREIVRDELREPHREQAGV